MKKVLVAGKKTLLFIDTGDNCRCPLSKGYMGKLLDRKNIRYVEVRTAGVMTPTGLLPTPEVVQLLQEEGVDIRRHRSRPLSVELIRQADLILGMTSYHVQKAIRMTEEAKGKIFLLKEYVGVTGRNVQIVDPMGGTMEIFKKCFSEIKQSLNKLAEMEFIAEPPEGKEMVVVDTTPKPKELPPEPVLPPKRELPSMSAETERAIAEADAAQKKSPRKSAKEAPAAKKAAEKPAAKKASGKSATKKPAAKVAAVTKGKATAAKAKAAPAVKGKKAAAAAAAPAKTKSAKAEPKKSAAKVKASAAKGVSAKKAPAAKAKVAAKPAAKAAPKKAVKAAPAKATVKSAAAKKKK